MEHFPPARLAAITKCNGLVVLEMEPSVWVTDAWACSCYCSIRQAVEWTMAERACCNVLCLEHFWGRACACVCEGGTVHQRQNVPKLIFKVPLSVHVSKGHRKEKDKKRRGKRQAPLWHFEIRLKLWEPDRDNGFRLYSWCHCLSVRGSFSTLLTIIEIKMRRGGNERTRDVGLVCAKWMKASE